MVRMPKTVVTGEFYDSTLAKNLRKLTARAGSVNKWSQQHKVNQTTVNRIVNGTRDATCKLLETLAEKTGYAPWQLLHPDFDPLKSPPMLDERAMRVAAVFASIKLEADKRRAESIMEQFAPEERPTPVESEAIPERGVGR
jgi:hypothetical protein